MRLMKLAEFRRVVYAASSAPGMNTLRRWIRAGKVAGGRIEGGLFWVDMDEYDRKHDLRASVVAQERRAASNPLLAGLI